MIDQITTIEQIQELVRQGFNDWQKYGRVYASHTSNLMLLHYHAGAIFERHWNAFEMLCRGLVLHRGNGSLIARGYDKFFNYGEYGTEPPKTNIISSVTEKIDGSGMIIFHYADHWFIHSHIGFEAPYEDAYNLFYNMIDHQQLNKRYTYLAEHVYPRHRVTIDYGRLETLLLLDVRDLETGEFLSPEAVTYSAQQAGFTRPEIHDYKTVEEILEVTKDLPGNREGFVAVLEDGTRWKFKGTAYRNAVRYNANATRKNIAKMITMGEYLAFVSTAPVDVQATAKRHKLGLEHDAWKLARHARARFKNYPTDSRKRFAGLVADGDKEIAGLLFMLFDNASDEAIFEQSMKMVCRDAMNPNDIRITNYGEEEEGNAF